MSVPAGLRGTGKLEVIVKALELAEYTVTITANEKIFLPAYQRALTDRINGMVLDIYNDVWTANNILVKTHDDLKDRQRLQERAAQNCNSLLSLIQLSHKVFHLKRKRVEFWGEKVIKVRAMIRSWKDSDCNRYRKVLKR